MDIPVRIVPFKSAVSPLFPLFLPVVPPLTCDELAVNRKQGLTSAPSADVFWHTNSRIRSVSTAFPRTSWVWGS